MNMHSIAQILLIFCLESISEQAISQTNNRIDRSKKTEKVTPAKASVNDNLTGAQKPSESELERIKDIGPISPTRHILGAIVGTIPGYGLGHAIQGRYGHDGGVKYTLYDLFVFPVLVLAMGAPIKYIVDRDGFRCYQPYPSPVPKYNKKWLPTGDCLTTPLLFGLVFSPKIFEIYSVIMDPFEINKKYTKYRSMKLVSYLDKNATVRFFARPFEEFGTEQQPTLILGLTISINIL